jgi:hypothetical protein
MDKYVALVFDADKNLWSVRKLDTDECLGICTTKKEAVQFCAEYGWTVKRIVK